MTTKLQRQLLAENDMVVGIYAQARVDHPERLVDLVIYNSEPYYLIPPDMLYVECPICHTQVAIDYIAKHIPEHRGRYLCRGCRSERRFQTHRGYLQHLRRTHLYPKGA